VQVIIDTGSDWLLIEGRECETCKENRYDPSTSSYFKFLNNRTDTKEYGNKFHIRGRQVEDQVCLGFDKACITPFTWYMITQQYGIPAQVDGILGLTQGKTPREEVEFPRDFEIAPLFMDYLRLTNWVTEKAFSTHFEGFSGSSYIDFGPVNYQSMSSLEFYVELGSEKGFFYSVFPEGIRFGGKDDGDLYKLDGQIAIFSSGLEYTMVPRSVSEQFFVNLLRDIEHVEKNGVFYVDCNVRRPRDTFILVQGRWIQISGDDMVIDISNVQDMSLCIINFLPSVDDFWVFGNNLYKDYYVTHKPDEAIIGFTPTEKQRKEPLRSG